MLVEYVPGSSLDDAAGPDQVVDEGEASPVGTTRTSRILSHVVLGGLSLLSIFPVYWMFVTSFKQPNEIYGLSMIPRFWDLENYATVWRTIPIGRMLLNTLRMAAMQTAGQLLIALFAAYAFTRWKFRGQGALFTLFVATWLVPFQATMIPNYVLLSRFGWLNSVWAIVVPQLAAAFAIILLRQHMKSFPTELLDAARMDGASSWGTLWRIVVPNLRAPIAALSILLFISAWNEYFWPLLVTKKLDASVIQIGIQMYVEQEQGDQWGPMMAAAGIATLPILLLYVLLQRHVIDAFVRSGLK